MDKRKVCFIAGILIPGLVVVLLPESWAKTKSNVQVEVESERGAEIEIRIESARQLHKLGVALLLYINDHKEEYPDSLDKLKPYYWQKEQDFQWLLENVEYLGKGKTGADHPFTPIAYDKSLLLKTVGTNVLRNDSSIKFTTDKELEKLGIGGVVESDREAKTVGTEAEVESAKPERIILRVVDSAGRPVTGAQVYKYFSMMDERRSGLATSDEEGKVFLEEEDIYKNRRLLLYALSDSELTGFLEVFRGDAGREIEWRLEPVCRVYGRLESSALKKLGQSLEWTYVYLYRGKYRPLSCSPKEGEFEFLVPLGAYELLAYGAGTYSVRREIEIKAGQQELETNFDLPADKLATLIGKPAPEFREIKGWIIKGWVGRIKSWWGIELSLSKLRGKVVLLDFWGYWCGPCVQSMPKLMELHDKYNKSGLVIIGIHDDRIGSIKELKKKLKDIREEYWDGRDIPFAVALDGGGDTEIEGTDRSASGATTAAYGIQGWPTMVLIDKNGKVLGRFHASNQDDIERLESMLNTEADAAEK